MPIISARSSLARSVGFGRVLDSGAVVADTGSMFPLATVTMTSLTVDSFVEFTNIPQTYKHLQIRFLAQAGSVGLNVQFNGVTSGYACHTLHGDGSSVTAGGSTGESYIFAGRLPTSTYYGAGVIDILDYSNGSKNTTLRSLAGNDQNGSGSVWLFTGLYPAQTPVSTIKMLPTTGSFSANSSFAIYGVL